MASENRSEVHPVRLIDAADAIMAHRAAIRADDESAKARAKAILDKFTNSELLAGADFLRRMDMGPRPGR